MGRLKIQRLLLILVLMWSLPTLAANLTCGDGLADLSLEKIIGDYAELAFAIEEAPQDSAVSILLQKSLEEKNFEISALLNTGELEIVKHLFHQKLKNLRHERYGLKEEMVYEEQEARALEDRYLSLKFATKERNIQSGQFEGGELSRDGRNFISASRKDKSHFRISVYNLPSGTKAFEKTVKSFDLPTFRFLNDGRNIEIENYWRNTALTVESLFLQHNLRTTEFLDTQTGQTLAKKYYVEPHFPQMYTEANISPSGNQFVTVRNGRIDVFDRKGKVKARFELPYNAGTKVKVAFDSSEENILINYFPIRGERSLTSWNIKTKSVNWKFTGYPVLSESAKYIFLPEDGTKGSSPALVNADTGQIIRRFSDHHLRLTSAILSPDSKMIFATRDTMMKPEEEGFIYKADSTEPGLPLELVRTEGNFVRQEFFDNNEKFIKVYSKNVYVWSTTSGASLGIYNYPKNLKFLGFDNSGNLIGSKDIGPNVTNLLENLQIWDREKN